MKESYEGLFESDSAHGNFKGAFENHKLFILYHDSIANTENTEKIVALQMNYDFGKKQDSLNVLQAKKDVAAQKELNNQILVRNGFISGTILFVLLAVAAILFFIDSMKRKRKKQMEEVRARISRDLHDDVNFGMCLIDFSCCFNSIHSTWQVNVHEDYIGSSWINFSQKVCAISKCTGAYKTITAVYKLKQAVTQ